MKKLLVLLLTACMTMGCAGAAAEPAAKSSFDFEGEWINIEDFSPGTVIYLPDFTGTGSHWEILAVSLDDEIVHVTITPIPLSEPKDAPDAVFVYEVRFEGVSPEDAHVCLELCKDGVPSWRCNLYVIVDPSLDVKIQNMELMPAYGDITHATIDYGTSEHFTQEDMDAALTVILANFSARHEAGQDWGLSGWVGFVLHEVHYTSDEESRRAFETYGIRYSYRDSQGRPYVDGIVFESSFHAPMTDDGWTGFESGRGYSCYNWILLKTEDGEWEIATTGY